MRTWAIARVSAHYWSICGWLGDNARDNAIFKLPLRSEFRRMCVCVCAFVYRPSRQHC